LWPEFLTLFDYVYTCQLPSPLAHSPPPSLAHSPAFSVACSLTHPPFPEHVVVVDFVILCSESL
jgi:hypothetical protein